MGTRTGDIDPGVVAYLNRSGMSVPDIDNLLNKKSGMLGLCGKNDFRDIAAAIAAGDADAKLAFDAVSYTHLDVYKRQRRKPPGRPPDWVLNVACLLYTSRCV